MNQNVNLNSNHYGGKPRAFISPFSMIVLFSIESESWICCLTLSWFGRSYWHFSQIILKVISLLTCH